MITRLFVKFLLICFFNFKIFTMDDPLPKEQTQSAKIKSFDDWNQIQNPIKNLDINLGNCDDFENFLNQLKDNPNLSFLDEINLGASSVDVFDKNPLKDLFLKLEKLQKFSLMVGNPDHYKVLDIDGLHNLKNLTHFSLKFVEQSELSNFSKNISKLNLLTNLDLELSYKQQSDFNILLEEISKLSNLRILTLSLSSHEDLKSHNILVLNNAFSKLNQIKNLQLCTYLDPENEQIFIDISQAIAQLKNLEELCWTVCEKNSHTIIKQDNFAKIAGNFAKLNKLKKIHFHLPTFEDFLNLKASAKMISQMPELEDLSLHFSAYHNEENYKTYNSGLEIFIKAIENSPKIRNLKISLFAGCNQYEAIINLIKSRQFKKLSLVADAINKDNMEYIFENLTNQNELEILGMQLPNLTEEQQLVSKLENNLLKLQNLKNLKELHLYACLVRNYHDQKAFPNFETMQKDSFYQIIKQLIGNLPNLEKQMIYFGPFFDKTFEDLNQTMLKKN